MVRLTDRPDMTLDVYRGRKTTIQQQQQRNSNPWKLNIRPFCYTMFTSQKDEKHFIKHKRANTVSSDFRVPIANVQIFKFLSFCIHLLFCVNLCVVKISCRL